DDLELDSIAALLPQEERSMTVIGGKASCQALQFSGNASRGLRELRGVLLLQNTHLKRDGRSIFSGVDARVELSRRRGGVMAKGRLAGRALESEAVLQAIDAPFVATLSSKFEPLAGQVSLSPARMGGTDLRGQLAFKSGLRDPFTFRIKVPSAGVGTLNPLLERFNLKLSSGSADL